MKYVKRIVAVVVAIALVFGLVQAGIYVVKKNQKKEVTVYSVTDFAMTEYWEDQTSSYGTVKTEQLQPVYLSNTQTVKEVYVTEGQEVKKGDPLFSYDTTLTEIQLQKQSLAVQKTQLELQKLQKELQTIQTYRPGVAVPSTDAVSIQSNNSLTTMSNLPLYMTAALTSKKTVATASKKTSADVPTQESSEDVTEETEETTEQEEKDYPEFLGGDGTLNTPYRYLWDKNYDYTNSFIQHLLKDKTNAYVSFEVHEDNDGQDEIASWWIMQFNYVDNQSNFKMISMGVGETSYNIDKTVTPDIPDNTETPDSTDDTDNTETPDSTNGTDNTEIPDGTDDIDNTEIPDGTDDDWIDPGYDDWIDPDDDGGNGDAGVTYTAEEIAKMLNSKQIEIQAKEIELRSEQLSYQKMEDELNNGTVSSELDGVVQNVNDSTMSKQNNTAFINVSAGGGYYVEAYLSESDLETIHIGDTVNVNCWESGMTYTGQITEISEYPTTEGYSSGNSNSSNYPFKIQLEEGAEVREYESVEVYFDSSSNSETSSDSFYLYLPFLRTENGENYVWVADENNKLRKQVVKTGKTVYDNYVEIKANLSLTDRIAFPYGSDLEDGVSVVDGSSNDFYSSY